MKHDLRLKIISKCGFALTIDLGMYLGIPITHKRITKSIFGYITKRVQDKLCQWKASCLPMAERLMLAKSIIVAFLTYVMQIASIPSVTLQEIENIKKYLYRVIN